MKLLLPMLGLIAAHCGAANLSIRTVFVKGQDIYTANSDGSDVRQLTSDQIPKRLPRWSPDAEQIAFTRHFGELESYSTPGHIRRREVPWLIP